MRLTLRQLQIFLAIVDTASTTAAGNQIGLSQSATSGALKELEHILGQPLFDRIGRQLILNEYGRRLLPQARGMLQTAKAIELHASPLQLRIGASTTIGNYVVPQLLARYLQQYPDADVQIRIGNTEDISSAADRHDIDCGLIEGFAHLPHLHHVPWLEDELVIVASPDHALLQHGNTYVTIQQLQQTRWLIRELGSGTHDIVEQTLLPYVQYFYQPIVLGNSEAIKQAAAAGIGLTCLSRYVVHDFIEQGRLVIIKTDIAPIRRQFFCLHHKDKPLSANLTAFLHAAPTAV